MKFSIILVLATLSLASAQKQTVKEQLMEHRNDMFANQEGTLKAIKDNHMNRMGKLEEMIEERRQMVDGHESGRRKLSDEEYDRASRQHKNFQRKLEQMKNRNDSHHQERLEELKSLRSMHRLDYLDIEEDLRE